MNHPFSPTTQVPPPLPTILTQEANGKVTSKLVLTPVRAEPYRRASAIIAGFAAVASLLTFQVGWGINLPLLAGAAIGVGFWRKPEIFHLKPIQLQLAVWLALAIAVVLHFDPWTVVPFILVTATLLGSLLFGRAVDPMRALARTVVQVVSIPWTYLKAVRYGRASLIRKSGIFTSLFRLAAFPVFMAIGFGTLYVWSNKTLSQWTFNFFDQLLVGEWFLDILQLGWSLFVSSLIGAALVYSFKRSDVRLLKAIGLTPVKLEPSVSTWSSVSIALVLVNALALILNTVDGTTTWIGEISTSAAELTRGVHSGTFTLIAAIVLAATYLLYNFRVQPKDYERARILAVAWLGQNLMMAFTVAVRNYHYTDAYGLTIKRIGVWLFLCCTATGLYFLVRQVRENGSVERLVRRQAWAVYLVLATAALPNWPGLITRYNHQEERLVLDKAYLSGLRPYNLDVWAEYNPKVVDFSHLASYARKRRWVAPITDFRAWDYRQGRRAALSQALPVQNPKVIEGTKEVQIPAKIEVESMDETNYDVTPNLEAEVSTPPN